jgi:tetratricopeptide (TPR) repeat protein
MGALPKPKVPDGPVRTLFDALHEQHHRAGWPSLRHLAKEVGCSHTTVSSAFSEPRVPRWGLLELIVEALGGDTEQFHRLWLAASDPSAPVEPGAPAAPAAPAAPRELPADVVGFTGRAGQVAELDRLLDGAGSAVVIAAVCGTAGVGKTALAVHWAHRVADRFPDGQLYLNLRGYDPDKPVRPEEALEAFLRALGVPGPAIPQDLAQRAARYRTLLAYRRMLIVLDNAYAVDQIRDLLPGTPSCLVLVTSRDTLPALVARYGATRVNLDLLPPAEATALLHRLVGARLAAEPDQAAALARHCAGLPLALRIAAEFAASRPATPLARLAAELGDESRRLDLLAAGDDEYTAVRAVFSWSYRHLDPATARAFQLLGVHPGWDFDRATLGALTGADPATAHRVLTALSRAHLVEESGPGRYSMHDLLHTYAAERAGELSDGERQAALRRLFDYYRRAAAAAASGSGPEARAWLDAERLNLLAVAGAGEPATSPAPELAGTLSRYLDARGYYTDALTLYRLAASASQARSDRAGEARAHNLIGNVQRRLGRYHEALSQHQQALTVFHAIGDRGGEAAALQGLAIVGWRLGRYAEAHDRHDAALVLYQAVGDRVGEGNAHYGLGVVCRRLGRYAEALDHYGHALAVHRETGDRAAEGGVLGNLGIVYLRLGRYPEALDHHRQALDIYRELGDRTGEGIASSNLGTTYDRLGHGDEALAHHQRALDICRSVGYRVGQGDARHGLGVVHLRAGRYSDALDELRQAVLTGREIGEADLETMARNDLGRALRAVGRADEALAEHRSALLLARETGDRYEQARALAGMADLSHDAGDVAQADRYRAQSTDLYRDLGVPEAELSTR